MTKKVFKQIHLWLSVPFGLIVTLICLSGAVLIFERDFGHIGEDRVTSGGKNPLPMDSVLRSTQARLGDRNHIVGVTVYPDPEKAYKVMLAKPNHAALWVDQYTGKVNGKDDRAEIFRLAGAAHRRLFGKSKAEGASGAQVGKLVIGITTVSLLLIIISGLIIWWPKKGELRKKLTISTDKGTYRFWYDFHCVGGAVSALILVICILTGLNWSFGWYRTVFYASLGSEVAKSSAHKTPVENFDACGKAYTLIRSSNEGKEIRVYPNEAEVVDGRFGNQQATTTYRIDASDGTILSVTPYEEKSRSNHIKGWIYTLHVGTWMGWISKILYLLCVITGALLPLTGYYLWIKRLILKRKRQKA